MTYSTKDCWYDHDKYGRPWREKTLRIFHGDDRQYWSITEPWDAMYNTSWLCWYDHGGEIYTGGRWIKLKGGLGHVEESTPQGEI